ncbi:MAG: hypothetical protein WAZ77_15160 [Candidatus Nitrosopolaris sp.]
MMLGMSLMLNRSIIFSFLCISFVFALVLGMVVTHSTGFIALPALAQQKKTSHTYRNSSG